MSGVEVVGFPVLRWEGAADIGFGSVLTIVVGAGCRDVLLFVGCACGRDEDAVALL